MSEAPTTTTRTVDGLEVPGSGTYALDTSHSQIGFTVRHMMIAKVRGHFSATEGTLVVAEDPTASTVTITASTGSIDTRDEGRDGHLKSPDFLDAEQYPTITFTGTGITDEGGGTFALVGDLTVHGVTKPLQLEVEYNGVGQDPWGNQRIGFTAKGEVNREDFGLTWNQALETGGVLVGKEAKIEIDAEFVRS
jgi:polyisoprenoid-binding protein YceI